MNMCVIVCVVMHNARLDMSVLFPFALECFSRPINSSLSTTGLFRVATQIIPVQL